MTRLIVGPFNRVEGDLEVQLEVADGRVSQFNDLCELKCTPVWQMSCLWHWC